MRVRKGRPDRRRQLTKDGRKRAARFRELQQQIRTTPTRAKQFIPSWTKDGRRDR